MAYLLRFDGIDDYVEITDVTLNTNWTIEVEASFAILGTQKLLDISGWIGLFGGKFIAYMPSAGIDIRTNITPTIGQVYTLKVEVISNVVEFFVDGVSQGTDTQTSSVDLETIGDRLNNEFQGDFYSLLVGIGGSPAHNYNASTSNGTGSILQDTVGSNDGTLNNFPTDGSQWVFYSAGGSNASAIVESAQSFTAAQAITVTGNITLSLSESAQAFTSAIAATTTGNISASLIEQAQAFISLLNATVTGNITSSIIESAQPFSTTMGVTVTSSATNNSSIVESAQIFTSAITMTTTGNLSASIVESAQVFTSAINVNLAIRKTLAVAEQAQPFTTTITVNRLTTVSGTILESAQVFVAGVVVQTPTRWTDKVFLDATWTDNTNPTTTWSDNTNPTNIWTDK